MRTRIFRLLPLAVLAVSSLGCAAAQERLGSAIPVAGQAVDLAMNRPSFSDADEERMAQENARAFEESAEIWDDRLLEAYVTEIVQRLLVHAEPRPFAYRIRVVSDASVNAFTFGGGLLYVHGGLIARMENEAQLAMVLGHEIAHVTHRHVPGGIERAFGLQVLGNVAASAASATGTLDGAALEQTYRYSMAAAVNGHGRSQEREADDVGVEYMVRAGYDPREAPETFAQLLREYGDAPPLVNFFYGSHPTNVSRFEHLTELARTRYADDVGGRRLTVNTEEYKRRTRELVVAMGVNDYESQRFNTARAMFEKAAPVDESDPVPHYYLGKITLETGGGEQVDEAIAHLSRAVAADAAFAPAHLELGLAFYRKRDTSRAIAAFEEYVRLAPEAEDRPRVERMINELRRGGPEGEGR